jgi:DUF1009 family protein
VSALGIIAGGGALPLAVAQIARGSGRDVFIVGLRGAADPGISEFPHEWISLGEAGRMVRALRDHRCVDVLLAGRLARPRFSEVKLDTKAVLLLPRVIAAARKGDDALLRAVTAILDAEGFRSVGIAEAAPGLLMPEGPLGSAKPDAESENDISLGVKVVRRLGGLDVGQSAIVCAGLVLAVEAAEGTDATILRVPQLEETIRGSETHPRGVLVKALKPVQDGKTDLPVIGVKTIENARRAHLAGIAVEAGRTLILDRPAVTAAADRAAMFVLGFASSAYAE